jgi:hypothetical protein
MQQQSTYSISSRLLHMRERMWKFTGRPGNKIKIITDMLEVKI